MISLVVEEYERGAWVADLVDVDPYAGGFFLDGVRWIGSVVSSQQEGARIMTRIVGGAGGLSKMLPDRYYDGSVSLGAAIAEICANTGEAAGTVAPLFLTTYERLRGTAAQALEGLADTLGLTWWIDRVGTLSMLPVRPAAGIADGVPDDLDPDGGVTLVDPKGVAIGGIYNSKVIRHIRWRVTADRVTARVYFVPFLFRSPVKPSIYTAQYPARVDKDNGDGTVDVIADSRFGVTKVPLYSGTPGAKIKVKPGEVVTLGFLGGDPRAPYAMAHSQNAAATKKVARTTDPVDMGKLAVASAIATDIVITWTPPAGTIPPAPVPIPIGPPVPLTGLISGGTDRIALDDG